MRIAVIDIGGTSIKSGIWEEGTICEKKETPTDAGKGGPYVMQSVMKILDQYSDYQAIGVSTAGQVNSDEGSIVYANHNIPNYIGTRIKDMLEEKYGVPVAVENDVNSAALGEAYYGAGKSHRDFLCLTYGTGVGGAIVMNGQIYHGAGFSAGEFGAVVVHPEDRKAKEDMYSGCYEKYASTTGLVNLVRKKFPELTNGRAIFARMEEPEVKALIDKWVAEIGYGLLSLIHIFNPSLIVLGGGIMEQPYVIGSVQKHVKEQIMSSFQNVEIVSAKLGNEAGLFGAAALARKLLESN